MKWEKVKLGELYSIYNGLAKGREYFGKGYPFISFSVVFNNYFVPKQIESLVDSSEQERVKYSIKRGDILITRTSETPDELGMTCVALEDIPNATYNGFSKRLRPLTNRVLSEYIGYYLRSFEFRKSFIGITGSMTTRASLRNEFLLNLDIPLPTIDIQRRIANILRSYDLLIENCRKQIALLEEAAQRLYREWFVNFRFPGHESTPIIDGLPRGWEWVSLENVTAINEVAIGKDYQHTEIEYVDLGGVSNGDILVTSKYKLDSAPGRAKRLANHGDVIWGMVRPNLRSYALVLNPSENEVFSTGFAVLSPKSIPYSYLYLSVTTDNFIAYLVNCTNGATYPAVKPEHFRQAIVALPPQTLLSKFDNYVRPKFETIGVYRQYISNLFAIRDMLLPRLMSGEIDVSEISEPVTNCDRSQFATSCENELSRNT